MTKKKHSASKRWRRALRGIKTASPFVIICGFVAFMYLVYRIVLLAIPTIAIEQSIFNPRGDASIVCGQEEGNNLKDPSPVLSDSYHARLQNLSVQTKNMITNPDLSEIDIESGQPTGYTHTIENANVAYSQLQDPDGRKFLRVSSLQPVPKNMPAWQADQAPLKSGKTYAYSLWYRSDTPVDVTLVYTASNGAHYQHIVTLPAQTAWKQFISHFTNIYQALNLGVLVSGTKAGNVDTRDYNIHQIPDATLKKGVISVTFDDGWESIYTKALPLLEKYNIQTTQYIIAEAALHHVDGYMSFKQIKQLKQKGHEIGSHTLTHCDQVILNAAAVTDNAKRSKQLIEQKQAGPVTSFAYPLGQYNQATQSIYEKYYPLIRTSDEGYNDRYFDKTNIHSMAMLNTTSSKQLQSWIHEAKKHHLWLVIAYHRVDESGVYSVTSKQLNEQLSLIKKSGLPVMPIAEAAAFVRK